MSRSRNYAYPTARSYLRQTPAAGPWAVLLRDKRGRQWTWRSGLTFNQAQHAAKVAKRANYRDPTVARKEQ